MERILYATTRFPRTGLQTTESLTDTSDPGVTGATIT
jgi:hypothetical protein